MDEKKKRAGTENALLKKTTRRERLKLGIERKCEREREGERERE